MTYWKLIDGSDFIGVATSYAFIRFQTKHKIMLVCDVSEAQYIMHNDAVYHAKWMVPEHPDKRGQYKTIDVIEISEEEYNLLAEVEDYEIPEPEYVEPPQEIIVDLVEQITIDYLVDNKIKSMSAACHNAITNGFDITLSDGETVHFSCTTQDQLNLITLANMAASGAMEAYPYHADGQLCKYFSADEIAAIVAKMQMLIARETTYFNSLKAYIYSLKDKTEIAAVYYGVDIPAEYQSEVYKDLFLGE